jgi:hypothetical protein
MTTNDYLKNVLASQTMADGSNELKALQQHRAEVEKVLRQHFLDSSPTIRYGGSKAKGTMIKESYDLDIICYFRNDDTDAGETLKDIYNNVRVALEKKYQVEPKTSSLRLKDAEPTRKGLDFHIDVVPGRFTDETKSDAFLYQAGGEKERLKTNIDVHIEFVKDSGVTEAIRLVKLWKVRNGIVFKHFVLELSVIKLLENGKKWDLESQLVHVLTEFRDNIDELTIEDPANPEGNDLSGALDVARENLKSVARRTLALVDSSGWEAVFGTVTDDSDDDKRAALRRVAAAVVTPTRPWASDEA